MKLQDWLRTRFWMEPLTDERLREAHETGDRHEERMTTAEQETDRLCRRWRERRETLPPEVVVPNGNGGT